QRASQAALENGVTLEQILERVASRREAWGLPVVLMTYVNPIVAYGVERFCRRAQEAGVGGVLMSDLPPEETPELWNALAEHDIETAVLTAPTTKSSRLPVLASAATGFLYCVSRTGVTGKGKDYAGNLGDQIRGLRECSDTPVVVGFGIRSAEDAVRVRKTWAPDGVVLGARLIEILEGEGGVSELHGFLAGIRHALDTADAGNA
ncbi:MAG: tryptophan synthase subunit alpha, partial [Candidatus Eisenbacteria bacterium]|nr:tryptophan synthase subunit alpha [Candidatus Eisenbacteria bacterium]